MFLLDTNIVIYYFKGMGNVSEHLLATPPREIAISEITRYELAFGLLKSGSEKRRKQLNTFLQHLDVLPFAESEALAAASIRFELERIGQPIGPMDTLIAATALANNCTLVTHNTREFSRVPNLDCVDWY